MNGVKITAETIIQDIQIAANNGVIFNGELYLNEINEYTNSKLNKIIKKGNVIGVGRK